MEHLRGNGFVDRTSQRDDSAQMGAPRWRFDLLPLDAGTLRGIALSVGVDGVRILRSRINLRTDQRGAAPSSHLSFAVMGPQTEPFIWCGVEAGASSLLVFPPGSALDAVGPRAFDVHLIMLEPAHFDRFETNERRVLARLSDRESPFVLFNDPRRTDALRAEVLAAEAALKGTETRERESSPAHGTIGTLLRALSGAAPHEHGALVRRSAVTRIAQAIRHARSTAEDAPQVRELCEIAGMKERTLRHAFVKYVGMPPKSYIQAVRLESVRRDLLTGQTEGVRIADVANRWGFWHMGQFAADYRGRFHELPSETVERESRKSDSLAVPVTA